MSYDINYLSKDFDTIVDSLINFATTNFGSDTSANRQWTNFNTSSFSRTWLEIVAYIGDQLFFYLDNQMTQSFLETTFLRSVALKIAKEYNYEVSSLTSASSDVTFTVTKPVTISSVFQLSATNGTQWFTNQELNATVGGTNTVGATQGSRYTETFTAAGIQGETINLENNPVVVDTTSSYSILLSPVVTVFGITYTKVNTFINSTATDTHFVLEVQDDGSYSIVFGDGILGRKLVSGETISVVYRTCDGTDGNVDAATITSLVDSQDGVSSVTNAAASGGSDEPTLSNLQKQIPASISTIERVVSLDDYADIIIANFNEVLQAKAEINTDNNTIDANVYVLPSASTVTNITDNTTLKNSIEDYLDIRKMVTSTYELRDAYGIDILIELELFLNTNVSRDLIESEINEALTDFFNLQTGDTDGSGCKFSQEIYLNTIANLIEDIDGIERFEIKKFTYNPRIDENVQGTTDYIYTDIEVYDNVEEREWMFGLDNDYRCSVFKRIVGNTTAISQQSISDNKLNLEKASGTCYVDTTSNNYAFDYSNTYKPNQFTGAYATGSITTIDSTSQVDGETFTINDGLGNVVVFEFDDNASVVESSILRRVDFSGGPHTADVMKTIIITEINQANTAGYINITASNGGTGIVTLTNDYSGRHGNTTSSETVANVGFIISDMSGGEKSYLLVDSANYIWQIEDNDAHTFDLSSTAINDSTGSVTPSAGTYSIVESMIGSYLLINGVIVDSILYNTKYTFYCSTSTYVDSFGSIGDAFYISQKQNRFVSTIDSDYVIDNTVNIINSVTSPDPANNGQAIIDFAGHVPAGLASITPGFGTDWVFLTEISSVIYKFDIISSTATTINIMHKNGVDPTITAGSTTGCLVQRYYDDDNSISFCFGTDDSTTSTIASSGYCLDYGNDTNGDTVDYFIFRTSPYRDDIINLRKMEIPELSENDITLDMRGGV